MTPSDIDKMFTYHPPKNDQPERYDLMRSAAKALAWIFNEQCPDSREKSLAITNLQQAIMWANASIAINE